MKNLFFSFMALPFLLSCNTAVNKIFGPGKTPHEAHADKIENSVEGKQWIAVAESSLLSPQPIRLPYGQHGFFPADKPRAVSLQFAAKRGEHVSIALNPNENVLLYADIFRQDGTVTTHLHSLETDARVLEFNTEETATYILRLQPQLSSSGQYDLTITPSPSLAFPVAGNKARVGSVWGDARDGGSRSHEGIDIFAAKLTPAIAAADGTITSVKDGGLGGKTIHLKVNGRNLSLYYAHLDQQLVEEGQSVQAGDTLGLVGNTGNARTTPAHLHFGIYTYGGAIDPLPFVNKVPATIPVVAAKDLQHRLQLIKPLLLKDKSTIKANTVLLPLAVTSTGYLAELENGTLVEVGFKQVKKV